MTIPGGPPPPPPPDIRSPDGNYIWNGQQWVPVHYAYGPPPGAMPPMATPPGRGAGTPILVAAIVVGLVVVGSLFVVGGKTTSTLPPGATALATSGATAAFPTPDASTSQSAAAPVAFVDPHGRWSATFGGPPHTTDTTEQSPEGTIPYQYSEWAVHGADQTVGVLVLPAKSTFDLKAGLQGIARATSGTVVSSTVGTFQGFPSIDGVITFSGGYMACREIHANNLVYIAITIGAVNPPADFAPFVASLKLTPG